MPCSNKPSAVMSWLEHVEPEEPYILIIDTVSKEGLSRAAALFFGRVQGFCLSEAYTGPAQLPRVHQGDRSACAHCHSIGVSDGTFWDTSFFLLLAARTPASAAQGSGNQPASQL